MEIAEKAAKAELTYRQVQQELDNLNKLREVKMASALTTRLGLTEPGSFSRTLYKTVESVGNISKFILWPEHEHSSFIY